jgi:hypothetical protein
MKAVEGVATENTPASGKPVLVGGRYDTTDRSLANGDAGALALTEKAHGKMDIYGNNIDRRGLNANKPLANAVAAGTTYWSVDTDPNMDSLEVSDGTSWTVMV